jgi:hypothetical protein
MELRHVVTLTHLSTVETYSIRGYGDRTHPAATGQAAFLKRKQTLKSFTALNKAGNNVSTPVCLVIALLCVWCSKLFMFLFLSPYQNFIKAKKQGLIERK